jgi:uncharacterized OsmC-like protein
MTSDVSANLKAVIDATRQAVAQDPAAAHALFQVHGTNPSGVATRVRAGRHDLRVDEPPTLGGDDDAANPVEHALAALASCQVVTYRFWAARLGLALEDVEVQAEGDLDVRGFFGFDDDVRSGLTAVRLSVTLTGPESPDRYRQLRETVDAHCPVLDLFSAATPVSTALVTTEPAGSPA